MPVTYHFGAGQVSAEEALRKLAQLSFGDITNGKVIEAARQIVAPVAQDDDAELEAIFRAVKVGDRRCPALAHGVRYTRDPPHLDFFTKPSKLLSQCLIGANSEDCDGHAALLAALCGAVGWVPGLRIVAVSPSDKTYTHVYAVVGYPKGNSPMQGCKALDTTVEESYVGWEPPSRSKIPPLTAVLET